MGASRRLLRGAVAAALVALPLLPGAPALGADGETPVAVQVTTLAPRAPRLPGDLVRLTGRLVNTGGVPVHGLRVRLRLGSVLTSRSALDEADREPPVTFLRGMSVDAARTVLAPGGSTTFDLRTTVAGLRLQRLGVYPLQVEARAVVGDEQDTTQVGLASTFVPFFPGGHPARTRLAWLWPLTDVPRQTPTGQLLDDGLAAGLTGSGRLGRLVAAARAGGDGACDPLPPPLPSAVLPPVTAALQPPTTAPAPCRPQPVPLTYAVDPALLDDVRTMTRPYDVLGRQTPGAGTGAAQTWLKGLRDDVAGPVRGLRDDLLALPYGDPDVVAVTRQPALRDDVATGDALGQLTAGDVLGTSPLSGVVWPPGGRLTPDGLDAVVDGDARAVVLDQSALAAPTADPGRTPGARARLTSSVAGAVTGLVLDAGLSALVPGPDTAAAGGPRLAEQRWLAETAMIAAERPTESRTLLVAPARRGDVQVAPAAAVIADTGRVPWLCPVALRDVVAGREACPGQPPTTSVGAAEDRGVLEPPGSAQGELEAAYLRRVERVRARAGQFTDDVLKVTSPQSTAAKSRLRKARLRTESTGLRADPGAAERLLGLLEQDVASMRAKVTVSAGPRVLLTSSSGTIRVAVTNRLDQPVTVGVRLSATNQARLSTQATPVVEVGPHRSVPVQITVRAATSGQFVVYVRLVDREQRPFGDRHELVVRSTRYGRVALAVTGAGALVLLVAAIVRLTRRAVGHARGSAAP